MSCDVPNNYDIYIKKISALILLLSPMLNIFSGENYPVSFIQFVII